MRAVLSVGINQEDIFLPESENLYQFITDLKNYMHSFAEEQCVDHKMVIIEFS